MSEAKPTIARQVLIGAMLLLIVIAIAGLGGLANAGNTDGWYEGVEKVPWDPPNWLFAPAWSTLYLMIAIAGFLIWRSGYSGRGRSNAAKKTLTIFTIQLVLNCAWSPTFFAGYPLVGESAWWIAMAIILALIAVVVWLIVDAAKRSKTAAWLLVPYVLWMAYASTLNAGVIVLN